MVASESLEVGAAVDKPHFVFAQPVDAVLRVVAVHDGDIVAFHVVQVAGGKCQTVDLPMPPFCVANATKISLLIVPFILIVDDLFFCFHTDLAVAPSASRLHTQAGRRVSGSVVKRCVGQMVIDDIAS